MYSGHNRLLLFIALVGGFFVASLILPAEQGYRAAKKALSDAAEEGQVMAQFHLGRMYLDGKGVPKDLEEAVKWFRKAADQGDALALWALENLESE